MEQKPPEGEEQVEVESPETETPQMSRTGLPSFTELARSAHRGIGFDLSIIEEASSGLGPTNGGIRCDVSRGPCACGAWH